MRVETRHCNILLLLITQDSMYHALCYSGNEALAWTRHNSMGPPTGNDRTILGLPLSDILLYSTSGIELSLTVYEVDTVSEDLVFPSQGSTLSVAQSVLATKIWLRLLEFYSQ